jgi:hypothetical protein
VGRVDMNFSSSLPRETGDEAEAPVGHEVFRPVTPLRRSGSAQLRCSGVARFGPAPFG